MKTNSSGTTGHIHISILLFFLFLPTLLITKDSGLIYFGWARFYCTWWKYSDTHVGEVFITALCACHPIHTNSKGENIHLNYLECVNEQCICVQSNNYLNIAFKSACTNLLHLRTILYKYLKVKILAMCRLTTCSSIQTVKQFYLPLWTKCCGKKTILR